MCVLLQDMKSGLWSVPGKILDVRPSSRSVFVEVDPEYLRYEENIKKHSAETRDRACSVSDKQNQLKKGSCLRDTMM